MQHQRICILAACALPVLWHVFRSHDVQVMEWTQQMLVIGESFSSAESATLRDALARQSGKFFEAFHAGNMQVVTTLL